MRTGSRDGRSLGVGRYAKPGIVRPSKLGYSIVSGSAKLSGSKPAVSLVVHRVADGINGLSKVVSKAAARTRPGADGGKLRGVSERGTDRPRSSRRRVGLAPRPKALPGGR